jgi:hypothetical protein
MAVVNPHSHSLVQKWQLLKPIPSSETKASELSGAMYDGLSLLHPVAHVQSQYVIFFVKEPKETHN